MTNSLLALIIEDDMDQSTIFAGALEAAGFETEIIRDGRAGLDRLQATLPHIVILDLHLPYVPGSELLDIIREDERLKDTRVILATADPRMADMLDDKADLVLIKPISFSQLRDLAFRLKPAE